VVILEASHLMSGARRSKHRASDSDVEVVLKVKKMKVLKNEGNSDHKHPQVSFDNAAMIPNLEKIGFSFGNSKGSTSHRWSDLNRALPSCSGVANNLDKRRDILDLEEKELADEEEVDRLQHQNICGDIMEEVMDVGVTILSYLFLVALQGSTGLIGWYSSGVDLDTFDIGATYEGDYYVKFHLCNKDMYFKWGLVGVYGPAQNPQKNSF
jgi:hypothetical protein